MRRHRLEYAPLAEEDLDRVFEVTFINWGLEQAIRYSEDLISAISLLAEFPYAGRDRSGWMAGLRSLVVAQYLVLYRVLEDDVRIGCAHSSGAS
jgi:plasmid stabilization system protein ParE